jgi:hypothetical protein
MAAKVGHSATKSALEAPKRTKNCGAEHPGLGHPVANAMHQSHGDFATAGVKSVQIKSSWV